MGERYLLGNVTRLLWPVEHRPKVAARSGDRRQPVQLECYSTIERCLEMKKMYPLIVVLLAGVVFSAMGVLYVLRPPAVTSLPESVEVGQTITFMIEGDLAIRDVTLPVTFAVEAAAVSSTQISGTATAVVNRSDYGLAIPSVPSVANVEEEVELSIYFLADATG